MITSPNVYEPNRDVNINVQLFGEKSCNVKIDLFSRVWPENSITNLSTTEGFFHPGKVGELVLKVCIATACECRWWWEKHDSPIRRN